jgi:hypothetical protein
MTRFACLTAALAAAMILPAAAQAADQSAASGHYEWRAQPQFGPRAPLATPRRVWVADATQAASCDCAMMAAHATDCMARSRGQFS